MKTPRLTAWISLLGALAAPLLPAATITWNNTGTDFNAGASWTGGVAPGSADNATFNATATTQPQLTGALTVQGLTFLGVSGYTLSSTGSAITLTNTGGNAADAQSVNATNTSGTNTISSRIVLGGTSSATHGFTQASGGVLVLSGNISSTNSIAGIILRGTGGQITLSGNNTFAGTTRLSAVTLNINSATAFSSGNLVMSAGSTIDNTSGSAITLSNNNNIALSQGSLTFVGSNNLSFGSGTATISGGSTRSITTTAGTLTIGSIDADTSARNFTKDGAGTLVLLNAAGATYGGVTTLTAGTLQIGNNSSLGSTGNITFSGGTLRYGAGVTADLSSRIKNSGSTIRIDTGANTVNFTSSLDTTNTSSTGLEKTGAGTLTLSGNNTYTGATNISEGVLRINADNSLGSGQLRLQGGVLGLGSGDFTRALASGAGNVTIQQDGSGFAAFGANRTVNIGGGGGSLAWAGSNFFNVGGSTLVLNVDSSDATLTFANNLSLGSGSNIRTIQVGNGSATVDAIISGVISNTSSLLKSGNGLLSLTANNTYSGGTTLQAGTLRASHANALGTSGNISFTGGTLQYGTGITTDLSSRIVNSNAAVRIDTNGESITFATGIDSTNSGGLAKLGSGSLIVSANNTYTGSTTITAGTLQIGAGGTSGSIATTSGVTNNATLAFNRSDNLTATYSIGGSGNLVKNGSGSLTLSGNNTYTGTTAIQSGSLVVNGSIGSSSLTTISSGASLLGSGTVGALVINSGGTISPGNSPGTLTVGSTTWNGGGNYNWQIFDATSTAGTGWDFLSSSGTLTIAATSGDRFNINLWSISGINPDSNGTPVNFNASSNYSWTIASFGSIIGFSEDKFSLVTTASNGTGGFSGFTGSFSISSNGTAITLDYTAPAGPAVWNSGSGNWSDNTKWLSNAVPGNGSSIEFAGPGGTSTNNSALTEVGGIFFSANATGSYTVNGTALALAALGIENSSTFSQTVSTNLTLSAGQTFRAESANLTVSGSLDTAGFTLTTNGSHTIVLSGAVSGSGDLVKDGNETTVLTAANSRTGATIIQDGTLQLGNGGTTGSLSTSSAITNNGTFTIHRSNAVEQGVDFTASAITGTGSFVQAGSGTTTLTANNAFTGSTTITAGTLVIGGSGSLGAGSYSANISNAGTLSFNTTNNQILSGILSGAGNLVKNNSGALTLSGSNTYSGGTALAAGTLAINNASALGTGTLTITGGTLDSTGASAITLSTNNAQNWNGDFAFTGTRDLNLGTGAVTMNASRTLTINSGSLTVGGIVSGSGFGLTKNGSGTLVLSGNNSFSGGTTILRGTVALGHNNALGTGTLTFNYQAATTLRSTDATDRVLSNTIATLAGSSVNLTFGSADTGNLTFSNTGSTALGGGSGTIRTFTIANANTTFANSFTGSGNIVKQGSGTLILTGNNTFTGTTTISAGTLQIGASGASGGLTSQNIVNNSVLVVDRTGSLTLSGNMSGTGSLTKNGSGSLVLSGSNTYSGASTLNAGTLTLQSSNALGSSTLTQANSASLVTIATTGTLTNTMSLSNVSALQSATLSGAITVNNASFNVDGGKTLTISSSMAGSGGIIKEGEGALVLSGSNTYSGTTTLNAGTLTLHSSNALAPGSLTQSSGSSLLLIDTTGTLTNTMGLFNVQASQSATLSGAITVHNASFDVDSSDTLTISGNIGGTGGITKTGAGTLILSGSNPYAGATTINAGILEAANTNALGSNATVSIAGGSLLVSANGSINNKSILLDNTIAGPASASQAGLAFNTAYSNTPGTAGTLTLSQDSIIDLGTGGVAVHFASIANLNSYILHIFNWEGNTVWSGSPGGGKDQFYVDQNLGSAALNNIRFYSGTTSSSFLSSGFQILGGSFNQEIVAVPEPETWAAAAILAAIALLSAARQSSAERLFKIWGQTPAAANLMGMGVAAVTLSKTMLRDTRSTITRKETP
jgi:fibronectin-binding autotransporter adhesin